MKPMKDISVTFHEKAASVARDPNALEAIRTAILQGMHILLAEYEHSPTRGRDKLRWQANRNKLLNAIAGIQNFRPDWFADKWDWNRDGDTIRNAAIIMHLSLHAAPSSRFSTS